jgi:hypothetical protein
MYTAITAAQVKAKVIATAAAGTNLAEHHAMRPRDWFAGAWRCVLRA